MDNTWILSPSGGGRIRKRELRRPDVSSSAPCAMPLFLRTLRLPHVQAVHGPQHIYLRVNGRIIRDIGWAEQGISEMRLVLLGFPQASVEVLAPELHKQLKCRRRDLRRLIPRFRGRIDAARRATRRNARSLRCIRGHFLSSDAAALDALIQSWSYGTPSPVALPDISRWRELTGDMGVLENRYLKGSSNMFWRFHLETRPG